MAKRKKWDECTALLDEATDELADVLADMDAKISWDHPEAYNAMHDRTERAQLMFLKALKICKQK